MSERLTSKSRATGSRGSDVHAQSQMKGQIHGPQIIRMVIFSILSCFPTTPTTMAAAMTMNGTAVVPDHDCGSGDSGSGLNDNDEGGSSVAVPDWLSNLVNDGDGDVCCTDKNYDDQVEGEFDDDAQKSCKTLSWTATIRQFNDGHVPERLDSIENPTRIVEYHHHHHHSSDKRHRSDDQENTRFCHVHTNAFPEQLVDELYDRTCKETHPAWGTYVTREQIEKYWRQRQQKQQQEKGEVQGHEEIDEEQEDDVLFVETAARYLEYAMQSTSSSSEERHLDLISDRSSARISMSNSTTCYQYDIHTKKMTTTHSTSLTAPTTNGSTANVDGDMKNDNHPCPRPSQLWKEDDMSFVHGVALWGLRATVGSQVPYHLDYAEQIRYTTNIIIPPILAGTLQCTRPKVEGGTFKLSMEGISHYERHGYKCKLLPLLTANSDDGDGMDDDGIVNIPYKYNQVTLHDGDLPHWSTPIESIGDCADESNGIDSDGNNTTRKTTEQSSYRVIVGFNVFPGQGVGERVQAAPEHSKAFRELVLSSHKSRNLGGVEDRSCGSAGRNDDGRRQTPGRGSTSQPTKQLLTVKDLYRNKPLGRLLVKAKRELDRQKFHLGQQRLERELPKYLPAIVEDLVNQFGTTTNIYEADAYASADGGRHTATATTKSAGGRIGESTKENQHHDQKTADVVPRLHPDDILVFITQKLRDGTFRVVVDDDGNSSCQTTHNSHKLLPGGLVSMKTEVAIAT